MVGREVFKEHFLSVSKSTSIKINQCLLVFEESASYSADFNYAAVMIK